MLTYEDWLKLPEEQKRVRCKELSNHDLFRMRIGMPTWSVKEDNGSKEDRVEQYAKILDSIVEDGGMKKEDRDKELKKYIEELENL